MMTREDLWASDTNGDLHMITPEQRDLLIDGKTVVVTLANDEGTRELVKVWSPTPLGSVHETDFDFGEDTSP